VTYRIVLKPSCALLLCVLPLGLAAIASADEPAAADSAAQLTAGELNAVPAAETHVATDQGTLTRFTADDEDEADDADEAADDRDDDAKARDDDANVRDEDDGREAAKRPAPDTWRPQPGERRGPGMGPRWPDDGRPRFGRSGEGRQRGFGGPPWAGRGRGQRPGWGPTGGDERSGPAEARSRRPGGGRGPEGRVSPPGRMAGRRGGGPVWAGGRPAGPPIAALQGLRAEIRELRQAIEALTEQLRKERD
jgi:hypothetical protein